jgi:hypothetical protein
MTKEKCQEQSGLFQAGDYRNEVHSPYKLTWVWFSRKMVSVAQKLSVTEERCQEQICLFQQGKYRNKDYKPINLF